MALPAKVIIVEVGPRDGLQNEAARLTPEQRAELIEELAEAGFTEIEAGSFVSPRRVPQMAGTEQVLQRLTPRPRVSYPVLAPNLRGYEAARAAGARAVAVFTAASESFNQHNIGCSIAESLERFAPVLKAAQADAVSVRGYISCALGCPYEGAVNPNRVAELAGRLHALGCQEISLGDTIGAGTPLEARRMLATVAARVPMNKLALHFHDTRGQALANIWACLEDGAAVVDSSIAGLGGCPFAPGAAGNAATEDLVYMLQGAGIETGVDLEKLLAAARRVCKLLGIMPRSRMALAGNWRSDCH